MTKRDDFRLRLNQLDRAIGLENYLQAHPELNRDLRIYAIRDWLRREYRLGAESQTRKQAAA